MTPFVQFEFCLLWGFLRLFRFWGGVSLRALQIPSNKFEHTRGNKKASDDMLHAKNNDNNVVTVFLRRKKGQETSQMRQAPNWQWLCRISRITQIGTPSCFELKN
eukprot:1367373-Amphidinium_carterae.1